MTLGIVLLSVSAFMSCVVLGRGLCEKDNDLVLLGCIFFVLVLLFSGIRYLNVSSDEEEAIEYQQCLDKGYKAERVLGKEVCIRN